MAGWLHPKGIPFYSPGIRKGSIGISQVEVFDREMKSAIIFGLQKVSKGLTDEFNACEKV